MEELFQNAVGQGIGGAVNLVAGDSGAGHQGGTLCNVIHPLGQSLGGADGFAPDHIDQGGGGLHHIGGHTAGIGEGIMDRFLGAHMFPQELNAHIHQFGGIQSGAAVPGIVGGMGGIACKVVFHLNGGGVGADGDFVGITGVPGQGSIQIPEHAVPGHEGLTGAAFFAGAAVEHHGALEMARFDGLLHGNGSAQGTGTQQVVAAAMTASTLTFGLGLGDAGHLRQPRKGIKFSQKADDRLSGTKGAGKSGGDTA